MAMLEIRYTTASGLFVKLLAATICFAARSQREPRRDLYFNPRNAPFWSLPFVFHGKTACRRVFGHRDLCFVARFVTGSCEANCGSRRPKIRRDSREDRARIFTVDPMNVRGLPTSVHSVPHLTTTTIFIYRYLRSLFTVSLEVLRASEDKFHEEKTVCCE